MFKKLENKIKELALKIHKSRLNDSKSIYEDSKKLYELTIIHKYLTNQEKENDWNGVVDLVCDAIEKSNLNN